MKIIGSYNSLPLSVLTRKFTGSEASHLLFVFDKTLVVQSTLFKGVGLAWFPEFLKHNKIAWQIDLPISVEKEEEVYQALMGAYSGEGYDYGALAFWFFSGVEKLMFNMPWPRKNLWQDPDKKLCIGVYMGLPEWLTGPKLSEEEIEMTTPDKIGQIIKKNLVENGILSDDGK